MRIGEWTEEAARLDSRDPLASYRQRFYVPTSDDGTEVVYLVGNSLGLQPRAVGRYIERELEKWRKLGVVGHFSDDDPWVPYHELVREPMARLVGGLSHEVVVMNSLTVNLHLMMASFYRPDDGRASIVIEEHAFPSDRYAVESRLRLHGLDPSDHVVKVKPRIGEDVMRTEDIVQVIEGESDRIGLIVLGGVNYYTGEVLDIATITRSARRFGIPVGFDLAHAVGNVPLSLHDWGVDFAVWCSYKYLNAGPGSIAGCFVHERHSRDRSRPRMAGWWGHRQSTRFEMPEAFDPVDTADGWQLSNPPILLLASLRASLDIFDEVGIPALVEKAGRLTGFTRDVLATLTAPPEMITPNEAGRHGCQLSLRFGPRARALNEALESAGIYCDFRAPDVIRVAPVPLYNSFADIVRFASVLESLVE